MVQQTFAERCCFKHMHAVSKQVHVADCAPSSCCPVLQVSVCSCREGSQQGMQLLPLKPPEERWACSALFSCAAQLYTHQQFGTALTLFTAACDAAASDLVRQAKDDTHTFQACSFVSHASQHPHVSDSASSTASNACHLFLPQVACSSVAVLVQMRGPVGLSGTSVCLQILHYCLWCKLISTFYECSVSFLFPFKWN